MIDAAVLPKARVRRPQSHRSAIPLLLAGCAAFATLATNPLHPLVLLNTTPSEPPGLYAAIPTPIRVGTIVAFKAPAAAFPYADRRLGYLHRTPMLKAVAAGPGDRVCAATGRLVINGQDRAPIVAQDREGRALPRWNGCRRLGPDELFVFSARVPNSFDSRYFGPVAKDAVVGVFQLITPGEGGHDGPRRHRRTLRRPRPWRTRRQAPAGRGLPARGGHRRAGRPNTAGG